MQPNTPPPPYDNCSVPSHIVNVDGVAQKTIAFNREHPKYRCCCQGMHVTHGLLILTVLYCIGCGLMLLDTSVKVGTVLRDGLRATAIIKPLTSLAFFVVLTGTMIMALRKEKPGWLLLYLVVQGLAVFSTALSLLAVIVTAGQVLDDYGIGPELRVSIGLITLLLAFHTWIFSVLLKCYRFYRDLDAYKSSYNNNAPANGLT